MTDAEAFIAHYGVKGMKWGVRKDRGHEGQKATVEEIARLDKAYENSFRDKKKLDLIHGALVSEVEERLPMVNARFERYGRDGLFNSTTGQPTRIGQIYLKQYETMVENSLSAVNYVIGPNPSGTRQWTLERTGSGTSSYWVATMKDLSPKEQRKVDKVTKRIIRDEEIFREAEAKRNAKVKHAVTIDEEALLQLKLTPVLGENGLFTGLNVENLENESQLVHYGIKGMKWGIRRSEAELRRSRGLAPSSEDHVRSRRLRRKSLREMDNAEIEVLTKRLQLEKKYKELNPSNYQKAEKFVNRVVSTANTIQQVDRMIGSPMTKAVEQAIKNARKR